MQLVSANHTESSFVILLAMIFAGLVFEDAGSHWETRLDDRADKVNKDHLRHWHEYLRTCFKSDPIGRLYARALVLKLKFELGVAFAMTSAAAGIVLLAISGLNWRIILGTELVCVLFLRWGLYEASHTHALLGRIRAQLLEGVLIAGQVKPEVGA
jgi:hypothetical protein